MSETVLGRFVEMLQQDFMINVLVGTLLVAGVCAYLGVFVVLRRAVFVGAALAQISSLGVALSFFACGLLERWLGRDVHFPPQPFALALTLAASVVFAAQHREGRLPRETIIGAAYAAAAGLAILVVAASAHVHAEVLNMLFGNVLTITVPGVVGLGALAMIIAVVHWLFFKQFLFASFDPDMATALGVPARLWNTLLFLSIGLTISIAINAAGAMVVFNFLVLPAATALMLGNSLRAVFIIAILVGMAGGVAGVSLSYVGNLPTGPTIIAVSASILSVVWLVRRVV
jgi:zinc transport system permease protein